MGKSSEYTVHTLEQVIVERWQFVGRRTVGNVRLFDKFKRKPNLDSEVVVSNVNLEDKLP